MEYKILKKGRKWLQAENNKNQKAQILINEVSKDFEIGKKYDIKGNVDIKRSGGFTKVNITPLTENDKIEFDNNKEVEKWLGYVECKTQYVYTRGVEELKKLKLNENQQSRLNKALELATINYSKNRIDDYFMYINKSLVENKWYENGEIVINENIEILKTYKINVSGYEKKLKELKNTYSENKKIIKEQNDKRYFHISDLSICKDDNYSIGDIITCEKTGKIGKVIKTSKYYEPDTMSFGYMQDGGWIKTAKCDTTIITDSELEDYKEKIRLQNKELEKFRNEEKLKNEKQKNIKMLINYISDNGDLAEKNNNIHVSELIKKGKVINDSFTIYGNGNMLITVNDLIWSIDNNGMDGDMWDMNNISTGGAGAIGYYMTIDSNIKELLEKIK